LKPLAESACLLIVSVSRKNWPNHIRLIPVERAVGSKRRLKDFPAAKSDLRASLRPNRRINIRLDVYTGQKIGCPNSMKKLWWKQH